MHVSLWCLRARVGRPSQEITRPGGELPKGEEPVPGPALKGDSRDLAAEKAGFGSGSTYEGEDPTASVLSINVNRRHLNASQLAMVAVKLATLGKGQ